MRVYIAKFCNARLHFRGMGVANFRSLPIDLELELFFESYMDLIEQPSEGIELLEYIIV